jgi:hypothetical protein
MADGRDLSTSSARNRYQWTEIFRCFYVAFDHKKLLTAAAGILAVSLGWYVLSLLFNRDMPQSSDQAFTNMTELQREFGGMKTPQGKEYGPDEFKLAGQKLYQQELAQWKALSSLAGPSGRLRTLPWYEYRGPNPFTLVTTILDGTATERQKVLNDFWSKSLPTFFEPLVKLLVPIVKVFDKDISRGTRIYLMLCIVWSLVCWAFFGGIITRIAAVQLAGKGPISLTEAFEYVSTRFTSYLLSPIIPLGVIAFAVVVLALISLPTLIPVVGDVFYIVLLPIGLLAGFVIAALLLGLVSYPLMYCTLSVEGSDTFDAISRSYNYVMTALPQFIGYTVVAVLYGALVTLFVVFLGSLSVYLGKWALSQTPFSEYFNMRPEYLFVHSPESFGWKEILLHGSELEVKAEEKQLDSGRLAHTLVETNSAVSDQYRETLGWYNTIGAIVASFWLILLFMLMLGFSYSFFWSAMTMIYLLLRKSVDEVETDEVYVEDPKPATPLTPAAKPAEATKPVTLPMVPPSAVPPAAPATVPPAPAATTPPAVPPATPPASPPATDDKPSDAKKD